MSTVLMVANYAPDVGFAWWLMENFWMQLSELSRQSGLQPLIAYPTSGVVPARIRDADIETIQQPIAGRGMAEFWHTILLVRARRVRMIYFTDRSFSSWRYAVLRLAGVSQILTHDHSPGDRPPVRGLKGAFKSAWRRLPWISADRQICVSPLMRRRAIENARIPEDRCVVVQNGIVPVACTGDRSYVHRKLGLSNDHRLCITVARAHTYKRIDFAVLVAQRCVRDLGRRDVSFVFCGDGPDLERLRLLVQQLDLQDYFHLAGRRNDVRAFLCAADIAIHPSRGEAFSLAVVEYMSAGLALIVPDIPSVSQTVEHGVTGVIYPDGDVDAAAEAVCRMLDDPARVAEMGRRSAQVVRARYSFTGMNNRFREIIREHLRAIR